MNLEYHGQHCTPKLRNMGYNRFYINIIVRIIGLSLTNFVLIFLLTRTHRYFSIAFLILLFLIQVILIIRYFNSTNRDLAKFLLYLQNGDTSIVYLKEKIEKTFSGLKLGFNKINKEFSKIKLEKEERQIFINNLADHVAVGIIVFNGKGVIEIINKSALKYLNIDTIRNINSLNNIHFNFSGFLYSLKPEKQKTLSLDTFDQFKHSIKLTYIFRCSEFKVEDQLFKIVTFQDINKELEDKEVESWQKLTHVLRHEITNSITPIITTATTIRRYFKDNGKVRKVKDVHQEIIDDTVNCTNLIEERGNGLMKFISQYRQFTKLPIPDLKKVQLGSLVKNVLKLMEDELHSNNIGVKLHLQSIVILDCDKKMIEQVIINILRNSIESFINDTKNKKIEINLLKGENSVQLNIQDTGSAIPKEIIEDIFIPFFSTKEKGSGIGLSLSRQIMKLHGGAISINSKIGVGTEVSLIFLLDNFRST